MISQAVAPLFRRAFYLALPATFAVTLGVCPMLAQDRSDLSDQENHSFSSSTDALAVTPTTAEAMPGSPAPVAGGQRDSSYGYKTGGGSYYKSHLAFEAGGGFNAPGGGSGNEITYGGNFTVGAGLKFEKHISGLIEYQFLDDKLPGALIAETGANGGHAHIWSLTLAPVIDLLPGRTNDFYITGGGGFYRKVTSFTDPEESEYCTYFYCGVVTENAVVGHFSSNQGGWNVGGGFTHTIGSKAMGDNNLKLFAEARYLYVDSPAVQSNPNGLGTTTVGAGTRVIPVTLGIRF